MKDVWGIGWTILIVFLFFIACKKSDKNSVVPTDDNKSHVKIPKSVFFTSGRERALLYWQNNDENVAKAAIFWNGEKDSVVKAIPAGIDSVKVYIEDLEEGDYTFGIYLFDKDNNRSAKILKNGYILGAIYGGPSKKIQNITYLDNQSLKIDWLNFTEKDAIGTQVFYTNDKNTVQEVVVENETRETLLSNISLANRGVFRTRTMYKDVLDTLFTVWDTITYVNRKAVFDSLPGWKFRCKVKAEAQTISDFGGIRSFKEKIDETLSQASKKFQVSGINEEGDNEVHFYMTDISSFEGTSGQFRYINGVDSTDMDLLLIVNGHASQDDLSWGWLGAPYLTLGHDYAGLFVPNAIDALVHELGHFRGMYDLYFANVTAANNPINGQAYNGKKDMMNSPYGETAWSEVSKAVINQSADKKVAVRYWTLFSDVFQIRVENGDGTPVAGAKINLYPVVQHSTSANTVRENDVVMYRGTTDANGIYGFDGNNPFAIDQNPTNNIFNFLVKVSVGNKTTYSWMPLDDALVAGSKGEPYVLTIKIP